MGGLGYILGGAISGLGSGLVEQAKINATDVAEQKRLDAKARYDAMIENLKAQREHDNIEFKGQTDLATKTGELAAAEPYKQADDKRALNNNLAVEDARAKSAMKLEGARAASARDLASLQSSLSATNTAKSIQLQADIDSGKGQVVSSGDGYIHILYPRDGTNVNTGVPAVPKNESKPDPAIAGAFITSTPPAKPAIAPTPRNAVAAAAVAPPVNKAKRPSLDSFQR